MTEKEWIKERNKLRRRVDSTFRYSWRQICQRLVATNPTSLTPEIEEALKEEARRLAIEESMRSRQYRELMAHFTKPIE